MEIWAIAFFGGLGATVTPCILPLYPAFLAYITGMVSGPSQTTHATAGSEGSRIRWAPLAAAGFVWAGVLTGMVGIGALFALVAAPLGDFNRVVVPIADSLLIVLGASLVVGVNIFARLPQPSPSRLAGAGRAGGAFLYGLLFAPIAVPCSGPFLVGIFAFALTIGDVASQLLFFLVFGVGFGLPLFVLGAVGQLRGRQMARAVIRYERPVRLVVGSALVVVGVWDLSVNLPALPAA
ncbi:MAG: cytochrome c biogenesis CcdA family protein [Candidatus Limnocylindria bacterium]